MTVRRAHAVIRLSGTLLLVAAGVVFWKTASSQHRSGLQPIQSTSRPIVTGLSEDVSESGAEIAQLPLMEIGDDLPVLLDSVRATATSVCLSVSSLEQFGPRLLGFPRHSFAADDAAATYVLVVHGTHRAIDLFLEAVTRLDRVIVPEVQSVRRSLADADQGSTTSEASVSEQLDQQAWDAVIYLVIPYRSGRPGDTTTKLGLAFEAWKRADFPRVVGNLELTLALDGSLTKEQRILGYQLLAAAQGAFADWRAARDTYLRIYTIDPAFTPKEGERVFEEEYGMRLYTPWMRRFFEQVHAEVMSGGDRQ